MRNAWIILKTYFRIQHIKLIIFEYHPSYKYKIMQHLILLVEDIVDALWSILKESYIYCQNIISCQHRILFCFYFQDFTFFVVHLSIATTYTSLL